MAECVLMKSGGGVDLDTVTASAADVVAPKVIVGPDGEPVTGTMVDRGNWNSTELAAGASVTIPAGRHGGGGKVAAKSLAAQTVGTATNGDIITGKTAWVNGARVQGSIADYRRTITKIDAIRIQSNRLEVAVAAGVHGYSWANNGYEYMDFSQVASALGLTADKIKKGVTVCGVKGTFSGLVPDSADIYNQGTLGTATGFTTINYINAGEGVNWLCQVKAKLIYETGHITLRAGYYQSIVTNNAINLTGYTKLNLDGISNHGSSQTYLLVGPNKFTALSGAEPSDVKFSGSSFVKDHRTTISVDVSNINGSRYIAFGHAGGGADKNNVSGSDSLYTLIYRIWLS